MFHRFDRSGRVRLFGRFRRPRSAWLLSAAGALIAGLAAAGVVQHAEQTMADYGTQLSIAVASTDLPVGSVIGNDDLTWRQLPPVLVNGTPVEHPVGRTVVQPVLAGEPLVGERLGPDGLSPTEALIGEGRRALVIEIASDPGPLGLGDRVDLLSAGAPGGGRASWVTRNATIVARGDSTVTVAVDEDDAPEAARAALDGSVVLALVGEP